MTVNVYVTKLKNYIILMNVLKLYQISFDHVLLLKNFEFSSTIAFSVRASHVNCHKIWWEISRF